MSMEIVESLRSPWYIRVYKRFYSFLLSLKKSVKEMYNKHEKKCIFFIQIVSDLPPLEVVGLGSETQL